MSSVLLSQRAARAIFDEVQRWVEHGLHDGGMPLESMLYPLSALVPRRALRSPVELASVEDIAEIVIDGAAVPPDEVKAFSPHNCHFAADDIERASAAFNAAIDEALADRPRLAVNSKLHSHPFSGGRFLSAGDLRFGVSAPGAVSWRERRGLDTALLHVVYPDGEPEIAAGPWILDEHGAVAESSAGRRVRWRVHTWGSLPGGLAGAPGSNGEPAMRELGDAVVVEDSHSSIEAARRPAYWQTTPGAAWCDAQKAALRSAGFSVSRNLLGRGWRRYLVQASQRTLLFALPPDFPSAALRVLEVRRAWANDFADVPLRGELAALAGGAEARLGDCSLVKLVRALVGSAADGAA